MSDGWLAVGVVVLFALGLWFDKRKKERSGGLPFIRVLPPASNVFRNVVVLAVVAGLGWFFYWVMVTRCRGAC